MLEDVCRFQVWEKNTSGDADSRLKLNLHAWICLRWIFTPLIRVYIPIIYGFLLGGWIAIHLISLCLFKVVFYRFYHGKSPSNLHLGEYFLLFPSILSKSKKDFDCDCILFSELPFSWYSSIEEKQVIYTWSINSHIWFCFDAPRRLT